MANKETHTRTINAKEVGLLANGKCLYRGLIDNGDEVMPFKSGLGFVTKKQCEKNGWEIVPVNR